MSSISLNKTSVNSFTPQFISSSISSIGTLSSTMIVKLGLVLYTAAQVVVNSYKAYQFKYHRLSNPLDDKLKLIKCQALLQRRIEMKEEFQTNDLQLTQDSKTILGSLSPKCDQEAKVSFLVELAKYNARKNPTEAFELCAQLSSHKDLFDVADTLHKEHKNYREFGHDRLVSLYVRSFEALTDDIEKNSKTEVEPTLEQLRFCLNLAVNFYSLNDHNYKNESLKFAEKLIATMKDPFLRLQAYCEVIECYSKIEMRDQIQTAFGAVPNIVFGEKKVQADLILARTYVLLKYDLLANGTLNIIENNIFEKKDFNKEGELSLLIKNLSLYIKQLREFLANLDASHEFKVKILLERICAQRLYELLASIPKSIDASTLNGRDKIGAYLNFFKACHDFQDEDLLKLALEATLHAILTFLQKETDNGNKTLGLIEAISFLKVRSDSALVIMRELENLHSQKGPNLFSTSIPHIILHEYNEMGMTKESEAFFNRYLKEVLDQKADADKIINALTSLAKSHTHLTPEQKRALLQAAENLLPKVKSSDYCYATTMVAEGYVEIDSQKSIALIEKYESWQGTECIKRASIMAVALLGIFSFIR